MKAVKISTTKMTKARRLAEWKAFVALCFLCLDESDDKEIANLTMLSVSTIRRYRNGQFTFRAGIGTVQALGFAAGLRLKETEAGCTVRVVD